MAWSYDTGFATDKDKIRFLIGDTDTNDQLLSNEEITAQLVLEPRLYYAAATCANAIEARYSRFGDADVAYAFRQLARRLRERAQIQVEPYFGGISISDKESVAEDTDRPENYFEVGMFDNGSQSLGDSGT